MIALVLVTAALAGDPAPDAPVPAPGPTGDVYVASVPPGAAVLVDGKDMGVVTPAMVHLPVGDHQVDVRTACAHVVTTTSVREKAVARLDLTIPADAPGTVVISSTPAGAFLSIDGAEAGATPYTATVACGVHEVSGVLPGHMPRVEHVSVMAGEPLQVDLVLTKQEYGGLTVVPTPLDAVVSVDGAAQPPGPVTLDHLLAAPHEVSVILAGYEPYHEPVTVLPNDVVRLDVTLDPTRPHIPIFRLGLATAASGAGIGVGAYGLFTYRQAHLAYDDYLTMADDDAANAHYDAEVAPRRTVMLVSWGIGVPLVGLGAVMFATTKFGGSSDLVVGVGPSGARVSGTW